MTLDLFLCLVYFLIILTFFIYILVLAEDGNMMFLKHVRQNFNIRVLSTFVYMPSADKSISLFAKTSDANLQNLGD